MREIASEVWRRLKEPTTIPGITAAIIGGANLPSPWAAVCIIVGIAGVLINKPAAA